MLAVCKYNKKSTNRLDIKTVGSSHALEEDAPLVLVHGSMLKWADVASERRTPWSGWVRMKWREQKSTKEFNTVYEGIHLRVFVLFSL